MSRLNRYKHVWRAIGLVLLLVAMLGPWTFDLIMVPSQYPCSAPNVRLEGDYCGMPLSGAFIFLAVASGLVNMVVELIIGTATLTDRIRDFSFSLFLLLGLPFVSTLLMLLGRPHRRRQVFHILVLGLAVSFALFIGTAGFSRLGHWALWGIWLYIGLAVSGLMLEVLTFNSEKQTRLGI